MSHFLSSRACKFLYNKFKKITTIFLLNTDVFHILQTKKKQVNQVKNETLKNKLLYFSWIWKRKEILKKMLPFYSLHIEWSVKYVASVEKTKFHALSPSKEIQMIIGMKPMSIVYCFFPRNLRDWNKRTDKRIHRIRSPSTHWPNVK